MKRWFGATVMIGVLTAATANAAAPPKQAEGGAMQRSSVEGCVGAQLFDGVWRVKVLSVDPAASYNDGTAETGIGVKVQVRNGTAKELAPDETGFSNVNGHGIDLAYADENTVSAVDSGTGLTESLLDKKLPPGAASTVTIYFPYGPDKTAKPDKLLIAVDPHTTTNAKHVHYSVKDPSFRIHLSCPPH